MSHVDLTPDPQVLIALTHTPLQPLDALCELIDNSLDSFANAKLSGAPVAHPLVLIELPGANEVSRGEGILRVRDNGPGLSVEMAEKALRAGFSNKRNPDDLGLFGMGFNIASGKLGRRTRFVTARKQDSHALEVVVDLVDMQAKSSYLAPVQKIPKPPEFTSGTIVEVTGWWAEGNPNNGFIKKLAQYPKATVRDEIGRRYSTRLRQEESAVRIKVNNEACEAFEHCVWAASRSLERRGHGKIPALFEFNDVIALQRRCAECDAQVFGEEAICPNCKSGHLRTVEERVRGWVGIQRFDDDTYFGIDLIRNGRAIKVWEKTAFFDYVDELKRVTKDYPIDTQFGRIVGEVHLNHVPVDFLKQDFQRSSPEWQRAMTFMRGDSSLQPNQPGADKNKSPIFKLFQGYRRVRNPGTADMYMGVWDPASKKPKRVSRDIEKDYYGKFRQRLPGFYDDLEWWRLVEQADHPPMEELFDCPSCNAQVVKSTEECEVCGEILIGKSCINEECGAKLPKSAVSCGQCGTSQIPEIDEPWACEVCDAANEEERERCSQCNNPRGTKKFGSREFLLENSDKDDDLSIWGTIVLLADGTNVPVQLATYVTRQPILPRWGGPSVPLLMFRGETNEAFVDKAHPVFRSLGIPPEVLLSAEVAQTLYTSHGSLITNHRAFHSISVLTSDLLKVRWSQALEDSPEQVQEDIKRLFNLIRERLPLIAHSRAPDVFDELTDAQKKSLVENLLSRGYDIAKLGEMKESGKFLTAIDDGAVLDLFQRMPEWFFDGCVWAVPYAAPPEFSEGLLEDHRARVRATYGNCLQDCASFSNYHSQEPLLTSRARAAVDFLLSKTG